MATKLRKIDREFLITDSSLNSYSYRLLTAGYQLDQYKKNPIGYKMHLRDDGVVVRWEDFRIDGDKVYAKPVVNLSNSKGQQVCDEIENGFLNAASVGHIVALEISTDPNDYLPDQKGPTISKWFNRECSLVDIPGNYNALADLFDEHDNKLTLADFNKPQSEKMKQVFLTPEQITKLNLKADSTQQDVDSAIANLAAEAAKVPGLTSQLTSAQSAKKKAEDDLAALLVITTEKEVKDLVAGATGKKITKEQGIVLEKQYAGNPTGLKELLDATPVYKSIVETIETGAGETEIRDLSAKSYDDLDKTGKLERLKEIAPEVFKAKYKEQFKKDYNR